MILVHGFTSNKSENWSRLGWYAALQKRRMRVIAFDCRGHGESDKPHTVDAYDRARMAGDILTLMDHLGLERAHVLGFSMGSRLALAAALGAPRRFASLTLGGVGEKLLEVRNEGSNPMADAMEASDPATISDLLLRSFRHFADDQNEDRLALAALCRASEKPFAREVLTALPVPVLVVAGARDTLAGDPQMLADIFADGRAVTVPGVDHFSIIGHALFKSAVFDFLDGTI